MVAVVLVDVKQSNQLYWRLQENNSIFRKNDQNNRATITFSSQTINATQQKRLRAVNVLDTTWWSSLTRQRYPETIAKTKWQFLCQNGTRNKNVIYSTQLKCKARRAVAMFLTKMVVLLSHVTFLDRHCNSESMYDGADRPFQWFQTAKDQNKNPHVSNLETFISCQYERLRRMAFHSIGSWKSPSLFLEIQAQHRLHLYWGSRLKNQPWVSI